MVPATQLPPEASPQALAIGGLSGLTIAGSLYIAATYDMPWAAFVGIVTGIAVAATGIWLLARAGGTSETEVRAAVAKIVTTVDSAAPVDKPTQRLEESVINEVRAILADKDRRDARRQWAFFLLGVPTGVVIGILTPALATWIGEW